MSGVQLSIDVSDFDAAAACYARQDKVRAHHPDCVPWEYYTVLEHIEAP
jgi:hypothetical protein